MQIYNTLVHLELITRGFSGDKKYCATVNDVTKYLLRIIPIEKYEAWKTLFGILERLDALSVPMSKPIELGICAEGVYALHSWINGNDLETIFPDLSEAEQYVLGLNAGKILKVINSIPAPENEEKWVDKCNRSINNNVRKYHENKVNRFDGSEHFINFIEKNHEALTELLDTRPQCFVHGDFSIPNMMYEDGELLIIDFDRLSYGDPWSEFFKTIFSARISPHFTTGQLHGYFNGEPPSEFFKLMALYTAYPCLSAVSWAIPHGQEEVDFVKNCVLIH